MKSSPVEKDRVRRQEEIASFGAALLMKHLSGRFEVVGGTKDDRKRAREWAEMFMNNGAGVRWYPKL